MLKIWLKVLGLSLLLSGCTTVQSQPSLSSWKDNPLPPALSQPLTLLCSSDTHYQSERLESQVSVVPQMIYNEAILTAMLDQMQKAKPDRIILTGIWSTRGTCRIIRKWRRCCGKSMRPYRCG